MSQMTPLPAAASTMLAAGVRPPTLAEPRPQERVLRHTVEQIGDVAPLVPALAVPVLQMVDQPGLLRPRVGYRRAQDHVPFPLCPYGSL